ncbi:hypothetical protein BaRGS_00020690 [Batillaria attramentaria]|uniref:Uncharacterized protein n=1 Tax=Batillaria attramentaria TaxID=370345 RepID=A0ABD0KLP4_9CAEN
MRATEVSDRLPLSFPLPDPASNCLVSFGNELPELSAAWKRMGKRSVSTIPGHFVSLGCVKQTTFFGDASLLSFAGQSSALLAKV